ncbi:MAG TPA: Ig-like domain-containing protein, partial [Longimicrobiaceae bacterium]|nr:Ig-like domain-containing protein [Longimicrobiaceae bacterium]
MQALAMAGDTASVRAYEDRSLAVVATDPSGNVIEHPRLTWTTSNASVATVDGNGTVHGVALGEADVTAHAGEVTATARITVLPARVMTLNILPDTVRALPGDQVTPAVVGTDRSGATVNVYPTWSAADTAVADRGYYLGAMARLPGTTRLYATVDGVRDSVVLVVGPPPSFTIYPDTAVLLMGAGPDHLVAERTGTAKVTVDLTRVLTWTSSDPGVATVDAAGNVNPVGPGAATITATLAGTGVAST